MPKICYIEKNFGAKALARIDLCNEIIDEYAVQGFDMTLRQLYYQMVSRDYIANNLKEYKNLGSLVNDARLAGLIDWDRLVDRVRHLEQRSSWSDPGHIIRSAAHSYHIDMWANQEYRIEVWVEKNALIGVIDPICRRLDIPYFASIGYTGQSEMWRAAQRIYSYLDDGKTPIVLHLGDHDPSGVDMTRDIRSRFEMFLQHDCEKNGRGMKYRWLDLAVDRLALNYDQVLQYNPPPNPTKLTDSRATGYINEFGYECWELDALSPMVISDLIRSTVISYRDEDAWDEMEKQEKAEKDLLNKTAKNWERVVEVVTGI